MPLAFFVWRILRLHCQNITYTLLPFHTHLQQMLLSQQQNTIGPKQAHRRHLFNWLHWFSNVVETRRGLNERETGRKTGMIETRREMKLSSSSNASKCSCRMVSPHQHRSIISTRSLDLIAALSYLTALADAIKLHITQMWII